MQTLDRSSTTKHPLRSILDTILSSIQPENFCHTHTKRIAYTKGEKKIPSENKPRLCPRPVPLVEKEEEEGGDR